MQRSFFEEAYQLAIKEAGGEKYILSAVLHADERNKALSEQHGYDVFHYHLHVVYIPVVDKEIYFKKNNKNPELAGKLCEVIKQVSHSKKWPRFKDELGKWINSYSLLQDRFYEHMQTAGFTDFECGECGSTAEHLTVLEYKTKQEAVRADELGKEIAHKIKWSKQLDRRLTIREKAYADITAVDSLGKKNILGQTTITPEKLKAVGNIIKMEARAQEIIFEQQAKIDGLKKEVGQLKYRLSGYEGKSISDSVRLFTAQQRAPHRMADMIAEIMRSPPEKRRDNRAVTIKKDKPEH